MRITIAAIGKLKSGPETELCKRYLERFNASGRALGLGPIALNEYPEARSDSSSARKADEAKRLLAGLPDHGLIIALDETGKSETSERFANWIANERDDGARHLAFLIGGPDGHGTDALSTSNRKMSLGTMTLPHGLARIILLEQLYRAATILSGHPYHRA